MPCDPESPIHLLRAQVEGLVARRHGLAAELGERLAREREPTEVLEVVVELRILELEPVELAHVARDDALCLIEITLEHPLGLARVDAAVLELAAPVAEVR